MSKIVLLLLIAFILYGCNNSDSKETLADEFTPPTEQNILPDEFTPPHLH